MSLRNAYFLIFIILLVDQLSKIYIKTNFVLGEEINVFSWFKILFIENEGMAWGTEIPGTYGKLFLTIGGDLNRVLVVGFGAQKQLHLSYCCHRANSRRSFWKYYRFGFLRHCFRRQSQSFSDFIFRKTLW